MIIGPLLKFHDERDILAGRSHTDMPNGLDRTVGPPGALHGACL
jgi:hypothetical protein